jgi:serine/threonine protein phosphatase 1
MWWKQLHIFGKWSSAQVTDGIRIYAIGDVHGCSSALEQLLISIEAHLAAFPSSRPILVFLGDYIDRGPTSRQVIDQLILLREHREVIFLKGNHESYLLEFLKQPAILPYWSEYGGLDTLRSYGITPRNHFNLKEQQALATSLSLALTECGHLEFLERLKISFVCEDFFFVHAGVRPNIPLAEQSEEDLLSIRSDFLLYEGDLEKIVVHGHTPVAHPEVWSNRINIDTGAYATGQLTCLVVERDKMSFMFARMPELLNTSSPSKVTSSVEDDRLAKLETNRPPQGAPEASRLLRPNRRRSPRVLRRPNDRRSIRATFLIPIAVAALLAGYFFFGDSDRNVEVVPQVTTNKLSAELSPLQEPKAPLSKATDSTVESPIEPKVQTAPLLPPVPLDIKPTENGIEVKLPQTLPQQGRSFARSQDASTCFPSASAVLRNYPEGRPSWTLRAPGHEGTRCWYPTKRTAPDTRKDGDAPNNRRT